MTPYLSSLDLEGQSPFFTFGTNFLKMRAFWAFSSKGDFKVLGVKHPLSEKERQFLSDKKG